MKFADIVALAKAGYTPADVRDFMAATSEKPEPGPDETTEGSKPEEKTVDNSVENVDAPKKPLPDPVKPEDAASENKYKELYEKAVQDLKKAQAENTRTKQPEVDDPEKILLNLAATYL